MKYLVVDDSKMARKMTLKSLKEVVENDLEIFEACNGQEAIELYKKHIPDMCFMDLTMPILDGFDATKAICQFDQNARIIVISADIQEHAISRVKEAGALGFINKPISKNNLQTMLQKLNLL